MVVQVQGEGRDGSPLLDEPLPDVLQVAPMPKKAAFVVLAFIEVRSVVELLVTQFVAGVPAEHHPEPPGARGFDPVIHCPFNPASPTHAPLISASDDVAVRADE